MSEPDLCGCIRCFSERMRNDTKRTSPLTDPTFGFRYACELCGNKRCPHHTDHDLACTGSNEPGQPGSAYA